MLYAFVAHLRTRFECTLFFVHGHNYSNRDSLFSTSSVKEWGVGRGICREVAISASRCTYLNKGYLTRGTINQGLIRGF